MFPAIKKLLFSFFDWVVPVMETIVIKNPNLGVILVLTYTVAIVLAMCYYH